MSSLHLLSLPALALAAVLVVGSSARAQGHASVSATASPPTAAARSVREVSTTRRTTGERRLLDRRVALLVGALGGVRERYGRTSFGYAAALMIVGGAAMVSTIGGYLLFVAISPRGTFDDSQPMIGAGVAVGLVFFVVGLVTLLTRASKRLRLERRMQELEHELDAYGVLTTFDLRLVPSGAVMNGTVRF